MDSVREELYFESLDEHPVYCVGCGGSYPRKSEFGPTLADHDCSGICDSCGEPSATTWVDSRPLCTDCAADDAANQDGDDDRDDGQTRDDVPLVEQSQP